VVRGGHDGSPDHWWDASRPGRFFEESVADGAGCLLFCGKGFVSVVLVAMRRGVVAPDLSPFFGGLVAIMLDSLPESETSLPVDVLPARPRMVAFMNKSDRARAMAAEGKSVDEIATATGMTRTWVRGALERSGKPGRPARFIRVQLPEDLVAWLEEAAEREGKDRNEIAGRLLRTALQEQVAKGSKTRPRVATTKVRGRAGAKRGPK
jgi:hypothetical protein